MKIAIQILDGNLSHDMSLTGDQVDDYVAMLRTALETDYPDAEIEIDLQRHTSGCRRATQVDDDERIYDDVARLADEIANRIWVEWCEKHQIS